MDQKRVVASWPQFEADEIEAVTKVLQSGAVNYWTGEICRQFERAFAEHCDVDYGIAVANGTLALELALRALNVGPGDEVIVTPRSFIASASCVLSVGATPVFADVDLGSQNLNTASIEASLTPATRAVIPVHHGGWPCDMPAIMELAAKHNLVVIEDCAQAHGGQVQGRPVGSFGHMAAFSFCQDKIMSTGGEGGMVVTNDEALWRKAWAYKDHGKSYRAVYEQEHPFGFRWLHESFGSNWRLTEMQAAIGLRQLAKLPTWSRRRAEIAAALGEVLERFASMRVPKPAQDIRHANYRLYANVDEPKLATGWSRDRLVEELLEVGVPCLVGSCPTIYDEKAFTNAGIGPLSALPNATALGATSVAFKVHHTLSNDDVAHVSARLAEILTMATGRAAA